MSKQSLSELFAELQAERQKTWEPEAYQRQANQRQTLVEDFAKRTYAAAGDIVAPLPLLDVTGGTIELDDLVANRPAVLIFFRHAGCPACNIALPYYQRELAPTLKTLGVPLVTVSPQVPERLGDIKAQHQFDFIVASDPNNDLARSLNIVFESDEPSKQAALAKGYSLPEIIGTGTWELPTPAVIILDRGRVIRFIDISPDWVVRTEAETIISRLQEVIEKTAEPQLA
ncbi:peroxiredoxin-like family protein [Beijerinckia indica]|uniref:thioredoxin-dependent peroxiredoxin n=1 Tax=Beijerinckia indica subsp. indica (strain ATCC 9039 / DSM 1715 / NCIMB 8712) TaxID=395963 RepID=B2IDM8_BEII9|nr:peroxiredoxin-like family protein [Beijerinckia indica]ACB95464.1 alkyl hydroperoxide reductase/ Thiol specific antioxidant/ Mal allergen [Beijerinckia indica subsp. indica ATCC 9039]